MMNIILVGTPCPFTLTNVNASMVTMELCENFFTSKYQENTI